MTVAAPTAPTVGVVVPCYNGAEYLPEALDSILSQSDPPDQLVVVDHGSTDSTRAVASAYEGAGVEVVSAVRSGGAGQARNQGAARLRTDFVIFFDSDDVMAPGRLARDRRLFRDNPGLDLALCNYRNFADGVFSERSHFDTCLSLMEQVPITAGAAAMLDGKKARALLIEENFASTAGLTIRVKLVRALGGYNEELRCGEDFHVVYRALLERPVMVVNVEGFARRLHAHNTTRDAAAGLASRIRGRLELAALEPDRALARSLRRKAGHLYLEMAAHNLTAGTPGSAGLILRGAILRRRLEPLMLKLAVKSIMCASGHHGTRRDRPSA